MGIVVMVLAGNRQGAPIVPFDEFRGNGTGPLGLRQDLPKTLHEFVHLALGHDKGRQEPQDAFVRAIDNQSLAQRSLRIGFAFDGKLNSEDQSFAPHLANEIDVRGEPRQFRAQLRSALANIFEQVFLFDDG